MFGAVIRVTREHHDVGVSSRIARVLITPHIIASVVETDNLMSEDLVFQKGYRGAFSVVMFIFGDTKKSFQYVVFEFEEEILQKQRE